MTTAIAPLLVEHLTGAIREVFEKMVFCQVEFQPVELTKRQPDASPCVVASIGFAGSRSGVVAFASTTTIARGIAGAMLGIPPAEVDGELPDAIGELANLIAGAFRTRMAQFEAPWAISVPTVIIGSHLETTFAANVSRLTLPVDLAAGRFYVDLVLHQ